MPQYKPLGATSNPDNQRPRRHGIPRPWQRYHAAERHRAEWSGL